MKVIYLKPRSTWRAELRSDTLWGMLCWGIRYVWGEQLLLNMIADFAAGNPPFLLSSAFPYHDQDGERILYLPKPIFRPFQLADAEWTPARMKAYKTFKKIAYISLPVFKDMIEGRLTEEEFFLKHESSWNIQKSITPSKITYVHNSIDRIGGQTDIYNAVLFHSAPGSGLYFFLRVLNPDYHKTLRALWPFFEHMGLGGDASIGRGAFEISEEEMENILNTKKGERFISLSLYSPTAEEGKFWAKNTEQTWYQLENRKGRVGGKLYVTSHILKQPVVMFREGSSFPAMDKPYYGQIQLVKNVETVPHKVYQYGYAFPVYTE